jgi:hypothetical protein
MSGQLWSNWQGFVDAEDLAVVRRIKATIPIGRDQVIEAPVFIEILEPLEAGKGGRIVMLNPEVFSRVCMNPLFDPLDSPRCRIGVRPEGSR